jgi:hypothetical protein
VRSRSMGSVAAPSRRSVHVRRAPRQRSPTPSPERPPPQRFRRRSGAGSGLATAAAARSSRPMGRDAGAAGRSSWTTSSRKRSTVPRRSGTCACAAAPTTSCTRRRPSGAPTWRGSGASGSRRSIVAARAAMRARPRSLAIAAREGSAPRRDDRVAPIRSTPHAGTGRARRHLGSRTVPSPHAPRQERDPRRSRGQHGRGHRILEAVRR